jgi:hypothetical protein
MGKLLLTAHRQWIIIEEIEPLHALKKNPYEKLTELY